MPESLAPVILRRKAERLRKETGDDTYQTLQELERLPFNQVLKIALVRPLVMLFTEPIVIWLSICSYLQLPFMRDSGLTWFSRSFFHLQLTIPHVLCIPHRFH